MSLFCMRGRYCLSQIGSQLICKTCCDRRIILQAVLTIRLCVVLTVEVKGGAEMFMPVCARIGPRISDDLVISSRLCL